MPLYFNVTGYNAVRPIVMYVPLHCLVQRFTKIRKESTQTATETETKLKALQFYLDNGVTVVEHISRPSSRSPKDGGADQAQRRGAAGYQTQRFAIVGSQSTLHKTLGGGKADFIPCIEINVTLKRTCSDMLTAA